MVILRHALRANVINRLLLLFVSLAHIAYQCPFPVHNFEMTPNQNIAGLGQIESRVPPPSEANRTTHRRDNRNPVRTTERDGHARAGPLGNNPFAPLIDDE